MHKSLDFAIVESNKMLKHIYVATDSNHIAIYGSPQYPDGMARWVQTLTETESLTHWMMMMMETLSKTITILIV